MKLRGLRIPARLRWYIVAVGAVIAIAGLAIPVACSRNVTDCANRSECESIVRAADEHGPATKRTHAGRLLDAAQECDRDMQRIPPPKECYVRVPWENNRKILPAEAKTEAARLQRESLVDAIDAAAESQAEGMCNPQLACNYYIGELGIQLDIPYFRDNRYSADQMNSFLSEASIAGESGDWLRVGEGIEPGPEVQRLANEGRFVVASSHSIAGRASRGAPPCDPNADAQAQVTGKPLTCHGHIAIAAPDYLDKETDPNLAGRRGPWIRYAVLDGNAHTKRSTRASITFGSSVTPPIWVEYIGKDWRTESAEDKSYELPCVDLASIRGLT